MDNFLDSLGQGIGLAVAFFPITWFALRKQLGLSRFWDSKWGFLAAVVVLPILKWGGFFGEDNTQIGSVTNLLMPICICALLVYVTRPKKKLPRA